MQNKGLTITVLANMTANYGEGLGNISSVQKIFRNGKVYAMRSRESLKNALMVQSGFYSDLSVTVDKATTQKKAAAQKQVNESLNAANCRALEGGYMNTSGTTYIRKSSFYLTDAVACEAFVNETRFHNNLFLASTFAKANQINLQEKAGECGLMPYQYEYDKSIKKYSLTIELDKVGKDDNFKTEATAEEKCDRVKEILAAIQYLSLVVKGNLDNSEPLFIVGGIGRTKTHYFDNVVEVTRGELLLSKDLKERVKDSYSAALLRGHSFSNEEAVAKELNPKTVSAFFADLQEEVQAYYGV